MRAYYDDSATPLYITETGATTSAPPGLTEEEQAARIVRAVSKMLAMSDVEGILIHRLVERPEYQPDDPRRGFGVLKYSDRGPLRPKLAYCEFVRAAGDRHPSCR